MVAALTPVYRVDELRAIEARHAELPLMERAGRTAADVAQAMAGDRGGQVVVLAGPGNNGGDAMVVARWLRSWFHDVTVVFIADAAKLPADAARVHRAFIEGGGCTVPAPPHAKPALIVDGLFGIGLTRPLSDEFGRLVNWANRTGSPILALDVPTGLHAETGVASGAVIRATATAKFIGLTPGLLTGAGPDHCGAITVHSLELDLRDATLGHRLDWATLAALLPAALTRATRNVNKGTFGTLAIVGGAEGMVGATVLAGRAAMRTGAGKVLLGLAARTHPALDWNAPELMLRNADTALAGGADACVIGPGLGTAAAARMCVERALALDVPLVLDADALNLLAVNPELRTAAQRRSAPTLATPHPGEAARLLSSDVAAVQSDRLAAGLKLARELRAHVVLKGSGSVLAHPDGSWDINTSGGPALASAGTGDVLAGVLGSMLAQGLDAKTALRYAVCLHGAAADTLVARGIGPIGLAASELADAARELINAASPSRRLIIRPAV